MCTQNAKLTHNFNFVRRKSFPSLTSLFTIVTKKNKSSQDWNNRKCLKVWPLRSLKLSFLFFLQCLHITNYMYFPKIHFSFVKKKLSFCWKVVVLTIVDWKLLLDRDYSSPLKYSIAQRIYAHFISHSFVIWDNVLLDLKFKTFIKIYCKTFKTFDAIFRFSKQWLNSCFTTIRNNETDQYLYWYRTRHCSSVNYCVAVVVVNTFAMAGIIAFAAKDKFWINFALLCNLAILSSRG